MALCLVFTVAVAQDEYGDLLGRINNLRASLGLPAYALNGALSAAAQSQAQWLIDNDCAIAHTHPDGSSPRTRAQAAGYASTDVSENIYCGGIARLDDAWSFWLNSPIHYAGLTNNRYQEVGIGIAHGANESGFALVFGNPGGSAYVPPAPAGSAASSAASGSPGQPSYVVGLDEYGNIKHEIQDGDTLGDILLIYGYTWADLPALLALNNMTQNDFRELKVGAILLIPPKAGTYTPTPGGEVPTPTPEAPTAESPTVELPSATPIQPQVIATFVPTATSLPPDPTPVSRLAATANSLPQMAALLVATATLTVAPTPTAQEVAFVPTSATQSAVTIASTGTSPWLIAALLVQVAVLVGAGFEFVRRMRRR